MKNNLEDIFKVLRDYSEEAPNLMPAIQAERAKPAHRFKNHLRKHAFKYAAGLVVMLGLSLLLFLNPINNGELEITDPASHGDATVQHDDSQGMLHNPESSDSNPNYNSPEVDKDNSSNDDSQNLDSESERSSDNNTESTQIKPTTVKPNSTIDQAAPHGIGSNQTPFNGQEADPVHADQDQPIVHVEENDGNGEDQENKSVNAPIVNQKQEQGAEQAEESNDNSGEAPVTLAKHDDAESDDAGNAGTESVTQENLESESNADTEAENVAEVVTEDNANTEDAANETELTDSAVVHEKQFVEDANDGNGEEVIPVVPDKSIPLKKWSIEVAGGYGFAGNLILSDDATAVLRKNSETHVGSFQAAAHFNYEIAKNVEAQLGLNYNSSKTVVDYLHKYTERIMHVSSQDVIIFDYPGSPGRLVTLHDTTYTDEERSESFNSTNLIQSYQIPANLKVNVYNFKKSNIYLKAGVNLEIVKKSEGRVLNADYTWNSLNSDAYIRRNNLTSYQLGLGYDLMINQRISWMVEYMSQRSLNPVWTDESAVREIQINNNLKTGLKIHF